MLTENGLFNARGRYVICVGRLDRMKRIDTVIDAFGLSEGRGRCSLVIVGDGEARQSLEGQVNELGLQDKLVLLGGWKILCRY